MPSVEQAAPGVGSGSRSRSKGGWSTFPFIAGMLVGIKIAMAGVVSNLAVYLIQEFDFRRIRAAQIYSIISGFTFAAPVAGAVIADNWFGCFPVILVSATVSLLSIILFTLLATISSLRPNPCSNHGSNGCISPSRTQTSILFAAIALICLGSTGTRFNIFTMGANQFDNAQDQGAFTNWFFCLMSAGTIIGMTVLVYIEDKVGWDVGFGICVAMNIGSVVSLLLGLKYYHYDKPNGSPFARIAQVMVASIRKRGTSTPPGTVRYYLGHDWEKLKAHAPSQSLRFFNRAAIEMEGDTYEDGSIARPWKLCSIAQVEDFKATAKILPLCSTAICMASAISIQQTFTIIQALTINRSLNAHFKIPASSMTVVPMVVVVVALPLLDRVIYPLCHHLNAPNLTPLQRIGAGHFLNIIGIATSALIERRRLHIVQTYGLSKDGLVPMSVLWLLLPLVVVGLGEAFHTPGQAEFYYMEFPKSLRTTGTAMIGLIIATGFYINTIVISLLKRITSWLPDDINVGRIDLVFWIAAVACLINFGFYISCAKSYKYRSTESKHNEKLLGETK